ncbi:MAG: hypothetical protein U0X73_00610 [Thermoanaerobaculia bacterium]
MATAAGAWRRWARKTRVALHGARVELVYSPRYYFQAPGLLLDPRRAIHLLAFLRRDGLLSRRLPPEPEPASFDLLRQVHDDAYLEALQRPGTLGRAFGSMLPDDAEQEILAVQRAMVGGTLAAARAALAARGFAVNLGGGLHHARRDRGAGFCVLNDLAVAIAGLRRDGFAAPILIVDLDLHDGDGTRSLFADDPTVHTFSIHNQPWDEAGGVETTAIALGSGVDDARLLAVLDRSLPPVVERFRPRLMFYLAGADVAADDALGDWKMTAGGILARDLRIADLARSRHLPCAITLAGGYGDHAWRYPARFVARLLLGRELEPPPTDELILERFRGVVRGVRREELSGEATDEFFTAEDLGIPGAGPSRRRFLGFYTRAGIELALERLGYLGRLRQLGYRELEFELDLANPGGETLRIWGSPGRRELLVELRARRDRSTLPGLELLAIEWLLLQNPRAEFTVGRPLLPGQSRPGLGMLRETITALVLVCDRLHLDGIVVTPSRWHLARQARQAFVSLHPEDEGLFRSLEPVLSPLPLGEATAAAVDGRVVDAATGVAVVWKPAPMVLPVSERMKALLADPAREARVERHLRALRLAAPAP